MNYIGKTTADANFLENVRGDLMSGKLIIPKNYDPLLDLMETQRAIKKIKDFFQQELAYGLELRRVSAPLLVDPAKD